MRFTWLAHSRQTTQQGNVLPNNNGSVIRQQGRPRLLVDRLLSGDTESLYLSRPIEDYVHRNPFELLDAAEGNSVVQQVHVGPKLYKSFEGEVCGFFVAELVARLPAVKVLTWCAEESPQAASLRMSARFLAKAVRSAPHLKSLEVGCDVVFRHDRDVDDLANAFRGHTAFEKIVLSRLHPESADCRLNCIINSIAAMPSVRSVQIGAPWNPEADLGVESLPEWLEVIQNFDTDLPTLYMVVRSTFPCFVDHIPSSR